MSESGERSMETLGLIIVGVSSTFICAAAIRCRCTHLINLERERQLQAAAAVAAAEGVSGRILEEQRRRGNQVGLPAEIRKSIPVNVYDAGSVRSRQSVEGKEGNCCAICLVDYEAGDKLLELPCHHAFHVLCLDAWLQGRCTCPVCRLSLLPPAAEAAAAPSLEAAGGAAAAEGVALGSMQGGREPYFPDVESNVVSPAQALAAPGSLREEVVDEGLQRVREERSLHSGERSSVGECDVEIGRGNEESIAGDVVVEVVEAQSARGDGDCARRCALSLTAREEGLCKREKDGQGASACASSLESKGDVRTHMGILATEASVSLSMEGENAAGGTMIRVKDEDGSGDSGRLQLAGREGGRSTRHGTEKQAIAGDGGR